MDEAVLMALGTFLAPFACLLSIRNGRQLITAAALLLGLWTYGWVGGSNIIDVKEDAVTGLLMICALPGIVLGFLVQATILRGRILEFPAKTALIASFLLIGLLPLVAIATFPLWHAGLPNRPRPAVESTVMPPSPPSCSSVNFGSPAYIGARRTTRCHLPAELGR
jgi:hypothetical protein